MKEKFFAMKLIGMTLLITYIQAQAGELYARETKVSVKADHASLVEIFSMIEQQSEYRFFYADADVENVHASIDLQEEDIYEVMSEVLQNTELTYVVREQNVNIVHGELSTTTVYQQTKRVSGVVVDALTDEPIAGASIIEKGTSNGVVSGIDGTFSLEIRPGATFKISFLGYEEQEIKASDDNNYLRIVLKEEVMQIGEVVVTALGIKREEKALGYAVQTVKSDVVTTQKSAFVTSALTGKIAGVKVSTGNEIKNGVTIGIRGEGTMFVVDGIPQGGLESVGAEDIESITVLKGPTATAIYGSGGGNGAIMITTKRGEKEGLLVSVSSSNTFESGWLGFPTSQTSYSTGINGKYNPNVLERWGDKLDIGREALQYDPYTYTWSMQPLVSKGKNNLKNFMENPWVTNDNINVGYKGKNATFRNSLTYVHRQTNWPNNKTDKFIYNVSGNIKAGRFSLDASASVNYDYTPQEFGISGWNMAYFHLINNRYGAEYDIRDYRQIWVAGQENITQNWWNSMGNNPYFVAYEMTSSNSSTSVIAQTNATYEIASWLKADLRIGGNIGSSEKETIVPWGDVRTESFYEIRLSRYHGFNAQALLNFDKIVGEFRIEGFAGASMGQSAGDGLYAATTGGLSVPGFYSLKASNDPVRVGFGSMAYWYEENNDGTGKSARKVQSLFGKAGISWKNAIFIEATARNDWSSTLAASERSFFYPSVAGSISLSEFLPKIRWLDFWKIRGSWTQTKSPPGTYEINQTYSFNSSVWNNTPGASYPGTIRSSTLRPSATRTWETGTAAWLLDSRLKVDFAYYEKLYYDMQVNASVSITSGFENAKINSGEERIRKGVELTLTGDIIKNRNFRWTSIVNLDHYTFKYKKLDPVYSSKDPWITEGAYINQQIWNKKERFEGEIVHLNGLPFGQYRQSYGHSDPDMGWGWTNQFRYKNFVFGFQFDGVIGGVYFNRIHEYMWQSGSHPDSDNEYRYDEVVNGLTNYVGKGLKIMSGEAKYDQYGNILEDSRLFAINNVPVSYQAYATSYYSYDECMKALDWFKLREMNIGYTLPKNIAQKIHAYKVEISVVGQNLYLWTKEVWGADPEYTGDGLPLTPPTPRQIGFNIKIDF
jgi:TonB-linked SusC/RagA family outer membrane protein